MKNKVINLFGDKPIQNKGVKYSTLLENFIEPFINEFDGTIYLEDIYEFGVNAWNFGNMKVILPKDAFQNTIHLIEDENDDVDASLLFKMIDHKVAKFKEYTNFIVDFEINESTSSLNVISQPEEIYLSEIVDTMEHQELEEEFYEDYINRSAIIIKPKQPFLDWLSELHPEDDFEKDFKNPNIYLVDDEIDDLEKWLRKKFDRFFIMELESWHDNKKEWPQKRNFKMFNLWFNVDISESVYDLEKRPVSKSMYF